MKQTVKERGLEVKATYQLDKKLRRTFSTALIDLFEKRIIKFSSLMSSTCSSQGYINGMKDQFVTYLSRKKKKKYLYYI